MESWTILWTCVIIGIMMKFIMSLDVKIPKLVVYSRGYVMINAVFNSCDVVVKFDDVKQVVLFESKVKEHDALYAEDDADMPMYAVIDIDENMRGRITLDADCYDGLIDALELAKLIVKCFPKSNGNLVVADPDGAGTIRIKDGKIIL